MSVFQSDDDHQRVFLDCKGRGDSLQICMEDPSANSDLTITMTDYENSFTGCVVVDLQSLLRAVNFLRRAAQPAVTPSPVSDTDLALEPKDKQAE